MCGRVERGRGVCVWKRESGSPSHQRWLLLEAAPVASICSCFGGPGDNSIVAGLVGRGSETDRNKPYSFTTGLTKHPTSRSHAFQLCSKNVGREEEGEKHTHMGSCVCLHTHTHTHSTTHRQMLVSGDHDGQAGSVRLFSSSFAARGSVCLGITLLPLRPSLHTCPASQALA